jgi:hypothetical protein
MAKLKPITTTEVKEEKRLGMTLEELCKMRKEKEDLKVAIENEYYKLLGQIQLLSQQIDTLAKKQK